jgi:hypothetical protein
VSQITPAVYDTVNRDCFLGEMIDDQIRPDGEGAPFLTELGTATARLRCGRKAVHAGADTVDHTVSASGTAASCNPPPDLLKIPLSRCR